MSFHGVPRRSLDLGDPYHCQCQKTARLLAGELGLTSEQYVVTFQSRFGRARWLKPYTVPTLRRAGEATGVRRVDVVCPGFVSDCLETLEEIGHGAQAAFLGAGGKEFHCIPCLNEHPAWIAALADLAMRNLQGWLDLPPDAAARELTRRRERRRSGADTLERFAVRQDSIRAARGWARSRRLRQDSRLFCRMRLKRAQCSPIYCL